MEGGLNDKVYPLQSCSKDDENKRLCKILRLQDVFNLYAGEKKGCARVFLPPTITFKFEIYPISKRPEQSKIAEDYSPTPQKRLDRRKNMDQKTWERDLPPQLAFQSPPVAVLLLIALFCYVVWRFWTFTLKPYLHPDFPRELPYWIPCKYSNNRTDTLLILPASLWYIHCYQF